MHVTGVPEEERKFGPEVIFEGKMAKNLPKMIKDIKLHIKEAIFFYFKHIIFKLLKAKEN